MLANDVTERRMLEDELRQAQKMEAIGRLARGVAHDFNNLLSVILSYTDLTIEGMAPDDQGHADLEEVQKAARRAADLKRQLLAFGRRQPLAPRAFALGRVLLGMQRMLQRLLGEAIEVAVLPHGSTGQVLADPGQVEQVVVSLAINARDAMPNGGKLTIEMADVVLDPSYAAKHLEVTPGDYVMLGVSDNGLGMAPSTRCRVFEPFFTTKEQGRGTGLGLATVFGIVKQSKEHIWVYREPGVGTTFKVYFPRAEGSGVQPRSSLLPPVTLRGSETVLLVEDQDQVRAVMGTVLRRHGYRVIEARNGEEALLAAANVDAAIHLPLTDVVMPGMSGRELAERLALVHLGRSPAGPS